MAELENMRNLVSRLSNKKRNDFFYDKTDTMSIVSIQSSIFDLESSMTSNDFEDLKKEPPETDQGKKYVLPFKTKPLHFKNKKPDNWLYCNPKNNTIVERAENPIEWMRTIFDDNDYMVRSSKCNLKLQLSKSHGNLCDSIDFDISSCVDETPPALVSHKSVSDLKNISSNPNDDIFDSRSNMTLSKTAPGSTENVVDTRSSFQDFIALAKQQEESLKAEVMRRKLEMTKSKSSLSGNKIAPSMKYIKNGHLSTTRNRFGYGVEKVSVDSGRSKSVTTKYSRPAEVVSTKDTPPRLSLQTFDHNKRVAPVPPQRSRYNISQNHTRSSVDIKTPKLYHV